MILLTNIRYLVKYYMIYIKSKGGELKNVIINDSITMIKNSYLLNLSISLSNIPNFVFGNF